MMRILESQNFRISDMEVSEKKYARSFYELDVYKKAYQASLDLHRSSLSFPKTEQYALANQLRRSSKGICANIAEGYAKQQLSKAEFRRFLLMALGSAHEVRVWTDYAYDLNYISIETSKVWKNEYDIISRMLQKLISKL